MREGYRIDGTDFLLLAYGSYGDVFASQSLGLVRKVFRREHDEECARRTYGYELRAYELALTDASASRLVPGRFQRVPEVRIVDASGNDRTGSYYADLVFEMDWITADFTKIGDLLADERARVSPFLSQLHAIGIQYTMDASVAWATANRPTFIDFATEEFEVVWRE